MQNKLHLSVTRISDCAEAGVAMAGLMVHTCWRLLVQNRMQIGCGAFQNEGLLRDLRSFVILPSKLQNLVESIDCEVDIASTRS